MFIFKKATFNNTINTIYDLEMFFQLIGHLQAA